MIQRHSELRDLEAEMLDMVCYDVDVEPVFQVLTGETLERGANTAPDARLDIHARGVWERQRSAFFDVRVFHPNADSYRDLSPKQIYRQHENEKKRKYATRVLEIEQGTFTPLVFSTTGGMGVKGFTEGLPSYWLPKKERITPPQFLGYDAKFPSLSLEQPSYA